VSELSALAGSERYEVRDDEMGKQSARLYAGRKSGALPHTP
jgi:hypothetical protein